MANNDDTRNCTNYCIDKDDKYIENIVNGLGGKENINTVENCITRLRVNVKCESMINEDVINLTPNSGIVRKGKDIQIIFGLNVPDVRRALEDYLEVCEI